MQNAFAQVPMHFEFHNEEAQYKFDINDRYITNISSTLDVMKNKTKPCPRVTDCNTIYQFSKIL